MLYPTTIWKFRLALETLDHQSVTVLAMPTGARVLSAAFQASDLQIWAAVNPEAKLQNRRFAVVGTGLPAAPEIITGRFVGTVFFQGLVFHVFDLGSVF